MLSYHDMKRERHAALQAADAILARAEKGNRQPTEAEEVTMARRSAEARRLLGLRRAPVFKMAGTNLPPVTRPPAAVIQAGIK